MFTNRIRKSYLIAADLQHVICTKLFDGRLALAPIRRPGRALDIGTGTGIWALEFGKLKLDYVCVHLLIDLQATEHPETDVLGIDISPIQPDL